MANETKRERFVRIAEARTNKILEMMRLLGNCSSKGNYEYTEEDIRKMVAPNVLNMLETLNIDPLGVLTDSLMLIAPPEIVGDINVSHILITPAVTDDMTEEEEDEEEDEEE